MAGDPCICKKCTAIFNKYSILSQPTEEEIKTNDLENEKIWICEFCSN